MTTDAEKVLHFWLDEVGPEKWYATDDQIDRTIEEQFGALWAEAVAGVHDQWITMPNSALALLVLLDQFSRNLRRGSGEAFASDRHALRLAKLAIGRGHDMRVKEPERQFFYIPLMHSEMLADQERALRLIMMNMPKTGAINVEHGIKHRDVIRRFGRFPSRNAALGRTDTEAELAYRAEGGYMS